MIGLTLFITVGSTKFDKLIQKLICGDCVHLYNKLNITHLILQVGCSDYNPSQVDALRNEHKLDVEIYSYKKSIADDIDRADMIVGHAGAGTCLEVLRMNKPLLVVVNDTLMDNHQEELAGTLSEHNYLVKGTTDTLEENLILLDKKRSAKTLASIPPAKMSEFEKIFDDALEKVTTKSRM